MVHRMGGPKQTRVIKVVTLVVKEVTNKDCNEECRDQRQSIPRSGIDQEQLIVDHETVDRRHADRNEGCGEENVKKLQLHVQFEFRQGGFQRVDKFVTFDHVPKAHEKQCG